MAFRAPSSLTSSPFTVAKPAIADWSSASSLRGNSSLLRLSADHMGVFGGFSKDLSGLGLG